MNVINVTLVELRSLIAEKKEVEKKKFQMKKPHSFNDFKKHLLKEFNSNNENTLTIYSIDWDGELTEITEEGEFLDEDNIAFKVVYDESNTDAKENNIEEDKYEKAKEKDDKVDNDDLDVDLDDKELLLMIDEEANEKKEKKEVFNSKLFGQELLDKFISSQEKVVSQSKLNLDNNIMSIMEEKSKIFMNLKDISEIIDKSKRIMSQSKLIKKNEPEGNQNNHIIMEEENDIDENAVDLKFLEEEIELTKKIQEAKWIDLEVGFRNIGKRTFTGGDLYFEMGKESSEEFYLTGVKKERKQSFSLHENFGPSKEIKDRLTFRNEDPKDGNTYTIYLYIASDKYKIKMLNPLKITIHVEDKTEEEKQKEKEEKEKEEQEKKEKEEQEKKEKEEQEKKEKEEQENKEEEKQPQTIQLNPGEENNDDDHNEEKNEEEEKLQRIYNKLEEEYYISNFKNEEEIKEKIRELDFNIDAITNWIESIM